MKRLFLLAPCLAGLLIAGCGPDPRIQKQQDQLNVLVKQVADLQAAMDDTKKSQLGTDKSLAAFWNYAQYHATNSAWIPDRIVNMMLDIADLQNERMYLTNYLGARFMKQYHPPLPAEFSDPTKYDQATGLPLAGYQPATHGQMPASVAAQIRADAEKLFPTDYELQLTEIKTETEAWHKLNP